MALVVASLTVRTVEVIVAVNTVANRGRVTEIACTTCTHDWIESAVVAVLTTVYSSEIGMRYIVRVHSIGEKINCEDSNN